MDPTTCTILLVALAALTALGWGAWLREVNRVRHEGPAPEAAITIAPPIRAALYVPREEQESTPGVLPGAAREESPEWVMERMMDERFEAVRAPSPSGRGTDWL
jgi:hypothetical protein